MKSKLFIGTLLLTFALFTVSCSKNESGNNTQFKAYERSYKVWLKYKGTVNNSYTYTVTSGSVFGGGSKTVITIVNGKVDNREYVAVRLKYDTTGVNAPQSEIYEQWNENRADIGSHNSGATPLTLDQVYDKCRTQWLKVSSKDNDVYFEADNNGVISSCGYVPKGCMDDCFTGVHISEIKPL